MGEVVYSLVLIPFRLANFDLFIVEGKKTPVKRHFSRQNLLTSLKES